MSNGNNVTQSIMADEHMRGWKIDEETLSDSITSKHNELCPVNPATPKILLNMSRYLRLEAEEKRHRHQTLRQKQQASLSFGKFAVNGTVAVVTMIITTAIILWFAIANGLDLRDIPKLFTPSVPPVERVANDADTRTLRP